MAYRDTVKPWFETGDKPTQSQFWSLFDKLWFKDEPLTVDDIANLSDLVITKANQTDLDGYIQGELVLIDADGYYDLPSPYLLEKMIVVPPEDMDISLGKTEGGSEISAAETISSAGELLDINQFALTGTLRIYFGGITAETKVIIFKRKIKIA